MSGKTGVPVFRAEHRPETIALRRVEEAIRALGAAKAHAGAYRNVLASLTEAMEHAGDARLTLAAYVGDESRVGERGRLARASANRRSRR